MVIKKAAKSVAAKSAKKATKKAVKTAKPKAEPIEQASAAAPGTEVPAEIPTPAIEDPIGDTTDGEAATLLSEETPAEAAPEEDAEAANRPEAENSEDAEPEDAPEEDAEAANRPEAENSEDAEPEDGEDAGFTPAPRPPAKLERLQKILSQAGVASRRKAEEMIEQGRVQVNGTVVTELGTKADANRDHIRVDGKLLHGAERLRYFVLNKPKGFVTTVKDPEGRPTVMQFFEKMRERLYPVGRLDYMSEGLLVVTNDGDLANKLTKAGSGVEKTYLVKVAGQPTEAELELLRAGVSIERGKPGSPQVRTSPARIRQVRQGDNPWYEVVLIEGRNRELRKMFQAVGHFVEKIRRVGYGPLVLDQEPGNMRELQPEELAALRLAAEGKLRTPKAKEVRRRNLADSQLPTVQPKPSRHHAGKTFDPFKPSKPYAPKSFNEAPASEPGEFRPKPAFGTRKPGLGKPGTDKPFRSARPAAEGFRPAGARTGAAPGKFGARKFTPSGSGPARPAWKKDDRGPRPPARFAPAPDGETRSAARKPYADRPATGRTFGAKPAAGRVYGAKPATGRPFAGKPAGKPFAARPSSDRPATDKPAWKKTAADRPAFKRPAAPPRRETSADAEEFAPIKPGGLRIDPVEPGSYQAPNPRSKAPARYSPVRPTSDRPRTGKPSFGKPAFRKPGFEKPGFERPEFKRSGPPKPRFDKPGFEKPRFDRERTARSSSGPVRERSEGFVGARAPRPAGSRPFTTSSGKPRPGGARPSSKPFKPGAHSSSKPRPGGFSKSGPKGSSFKGRPGGKKRS